jgi:hypothetical protein
VKKVGSAHPGSHLREKSGSECPAAGQKPGADGPELVVQPGSIGLVETKVPPR